jgi:hypothetical protein
MNDNVFYVGKGTGNRAWNKRNGKAWKQEYTVDIPFGNLTEQEALDCEALLIQLYGFENLVNKKREIPKSKSFIYYRTKVWLDFIDTCNKVYANYDYYKKDKELIENINFVKDLLELQNKSYLLK